MAKSSVSAPLELPGVGNVMVRNQSGACGRRSSRRRLGVDAVGKRFMVTGREGQIAAAVGAGLAVVVDDVAL